MFSLSFVACGDVSDEKNTPPNMPSKSFPTSVWDGKSVDTSWYSVIESELIIKSAEQFVGFAELANSGNSFSGLNIKLCANIDLGGHKWTPIAKFDGIFDGNLCTVSNFIIDETKSYEIGLFSNNTGSIRNLSVKNFAITVKEGPDIISVGGLVGSNNGQIDTCSTEGMIDAYSYTMCDVGMLVGTNNQSIYNSYSTGKLSSSSHGWSHAGGLVGVNSEGGIFSCYSTCEVSSLSTAYSSFSYAGGLMGKNSGTIYDSFSTGSISSKIEEYSYLPSSSSMNLSSAGGIVGYNSSSGSIINCYRLDEQDISADRINTSGIPVTKNDINNTKLYIDVLHWDSSIWAITAGVYPYHK